MSTIKKNLIKSENYPKQDYVGFKSGRLTVLSWMGRDEWGCNYWECECQCGNKTTVTQKVLKGGTTISCGCYHKERHFKHGLSAKNVEPLYSIFFGIKSRCYNENNTAYQNYGGRGITICNEWLDDVTKFIDWAKEQGFKKGLSIDRVDNDKGYSPQNCRIASALMQMRNRRCTLYLTYKGVTLPITEWCEIKGLDYPVIFERKKRGWKDEDILDKPVDKRYSSPTIFTYNGKTQCLKDWSRELGIKYSTLQGRVSRGLSVEKIFEVKHG